MNDPIDKTQNYYNFNSRSLADRYEAASVKDMQKTLAASFQGRKRLLELGAGSGRDAAFLTAQGFDVTGIDGSVQMVDEALRLHPELEGKLFQGVLPSALESSELQSRFFDGIYAVAVLMHLNPEDLNTLFSGVRRLLVPEGRFLFSVPLERDDVDERGLDGEGRFFLSWSRVEWTDLARRAGFRVLDGSVREDGLGRSGISWLTLVLEIL